MSVSATEAGSGSSAGSALELLMLHKQLAEDSSRIAQLLAGVQDPAAQPATTVRTSAAGATYL